MRKILLLLGVWVMATQMACATDKKNNEIHWLTIEEAEVKMKEKPKKVLVDVYTSWCGWCKVMDRETYANDSLIKFVNENYYAVKLDAEIKTPITFMGKKWEYSAQNRVNQLAYDLLQGRLSYPTTVFLDENFQNAQPTPGYLKIFQMESILKYLAGNNHKTKPWEEWQHDFKAQWPAKSN